MARAKVKITPLGRRIQSNRSLRSGGLKKSKVQDLVGRDEDTENCPPNLDYNAIEEIANGVEKMILSWSHLDEGEQENKATALEPDFAMWTLPAGNKVLPHDTLPGKKEISESGFCEELEDVTDFSFSKQMQEQPEEATVTAGIAAGITAEILSLDGSCPADGMGHAISKIVTEAVKHSGQMMTDDSRAEKSATYWYLEASNVSPVEKCTSECTEETSGLKSCADVGNIDAESPLQSLHQKRSCEPNKLNSRSKDVSTSGQSFNVHSAPGTPPISERSVKRMQSQEDSSNKKLQLSMSKKTRWSEKASSAPINGACYSEDEDCMKSPRSDCSLLDLTSNSSWNDPLVGSPCRKPNPLSMDGEFGPWDSVAGHDPPVIVSRVTARPDSDIENCTKEKTSFVSFKLWKANKQSESGHEGNGEAESNEGKPRQLDTNIVPELYQGSTDGRDRQDCEVAAQTMVAPPTSESVITPSAVMLSNDI